MIMGQVGIISCFFLLAFLLLILNLFSHWHWKIKSISIVIVMMFYLVCYFSFPPLLGWPTEQTVPKRFKLVSEVIKEPNKQKGTKGSIYLWATDLAEDPDEVIPRSYRLPYTTKMHKLVVEAGNKVRKGIPQVGEVADGGNFGMVDPSDTYQGGDVSIALEFFDLPETVLPEK